MIAITLPSTDVALADTPRRDQLRLACSSSMAGTRRVSASSNVIACSATVGDTHPAGYVTATSRQPDRLETFPPRGEEMHPAHGVVRRRQRVDHASRLVGRRIVEDQRLRARSARRADRRASPPPRFRRRARRGAPRRSGAARAAAWPNRRRASRSPYRAGRGGRSRSAPSSMSEPQPGRVGTSISPFSSVEGCVRKSRVHGASSARSSMMRKFGIAAQKCALIRLARSPTGLCGATWVSNASASVAMRTDCQTPFHIGSTIAVSTARSTR